MLHNHEDRFSDDVALVLFSANSHNYFLALDCHQSKFDKGTDRHFFKSLLVLVLVTCSYVSSVCL